MAGFCWSPGFLQENENPRKLIDDLKLIVQKFNMPQIREMITQIENGENSIDKLSPQHSEFGDRLIKHLSENCGENHASKACFVNRLKKETQKVIKDVLDGEDNMRWLAGCLSVVAYIMEQENEPGNDARQFRHSLLYMFSLLKHIKQTTAWDVTPQMLNDVAQFIVLGCLLFHIQLHQPNLQWCGSILNETDTTNLEFRLGSTYKKLAFGSIMKNIPTSLYSSQTRRTSEVAINKARDGVIELLRVTSDDESRRAVVIEGTDGIGKTTVANAAIKFLDLRCYKVTRLDIDDYVSEPDIKILQQRFLRDLFGKCIHLKNCVDGRARLSNAFREEACWPVFMFIDNAHFQFDIAKLLPAEGEWLPVKSRILITTPDRSLCTLPAYLTPFHFQMNPLADSDAKDLISQNVTGSGEAIDSLMTKCRGIPLALVMLSSYLRQLGGKVAPNAFESIIPSPTEADICSSIVHFIYSSLEEKEKEAFLDIAIFFNNWERRLVSQIFCDIQLNVLEEKGLLMISREGKLRINAAVRKHATHISGKDRITDVESFKDALQDKEKLSKIKGIWHSEGDSELQLQAEDLDVMHTSLRVLYLGRSTKVNGECRNNFGDLRFLYLYQEDCLPLSLRNLASVNFYRSRLQNNGDFYELNRSVDDLKLRGISKLPTLVRELQLTRSLHVLDLSDSPNMQKLPQGFKCFSSLKVLDLNKCFRLTCLPESISELESLYRLNLRGCSELKELPETLGDLSCLAELDCTENHKLDVVPDSFSKLKSLRHLQFRGCSQLAYLPKSFGNLSSLEYLDLSHCTELSVLPNSFQKLTSLSLFRIADSSLIQLPENFGNLSSLKELDLSENKKLESLEKPVQIFDRNTESLDMNLEMSRRSFGELRSLCYLYLKGCSNLISLPATFPELSDLEELDLNGCDKLSSLSDNFGYFKCLRVLKLSCSRLTKLPANILFMLSLREMILTGCQKLVKLPSGVCNLESLSHLHLVGCSELAELPADFERLSSLEELELTDCRKLKSLPNQPSSVRVLKLWGCLQFSGLPENIGKLSKLEELVLKGCESLKTLPSSLRETKSLRHLRLRGASKVIGFPEDTPSSIETLDLGGCSSLEMRQQQGLRNYSSLKLLFLNGCLKLSALPHDFGKLNSLRYLSIAGCTELKTLPDCLESLVNLLAVDASKCPVLQGDTMDRLAELPCLYFVDVRGSPALIDRWKEGRELHHKLIVWSHMDEEATYDDTIISCLSQQIKQPHEEARFLQTMITYFSPRSMTRTERFALVVTCSTGSPESEVLKNKEKNRLQKNGFHICSIDMSETSENSSEVKSRNLLCYAVLRMLKKRHPETFAALEILHTWIVAADVCTGKEGRQHIVNLEVKLPAVGDGHRQDIDILGGVLRFFPPLLGVVAENLARSTSENP